ncbi:MAG: ABC transporter permease [Planctomycetes bacterium]|nr:ABC transporter permease [Planctomycetota bacterium]MCH9725293.1 ABC transporter permease [Planctomycetota bacterium]MCH9779487.1 ABC transporter permease [Planctomycetota bacterium]MCH9792624.1 ABC transporter permease [Planctomycetota bacterium]
MMRDSFYLAWQYICHHRITTAVLVSSITMITYLPAALEVIVDNAEQHFRSRANSTPLVVGLRGSPLELVFASLYFEKPYNAVIRMSQLQRIEKQNLCQAIPLHTRFESRDFSIVGTTIDYASLRRLRVDQGRIWRLLGECVVGSHVAEQLDLRVGSKLPVTTTAAFTLDNAPLRLKVVGIFTATETPDDEAIFVDLKTTWIMEGLGHGHVKGARHGSPEGTAYTEITNENVDSFHFHGEENQFPITSIIVVPENQKAETLLRGQYLSPEDTTQIVCPREVMDSLLDKVFMVRSYMISIIAVVSLVTMLTVSLVLVLSIRLRRGEIATMKKIGCSRFTIAVLLGSQIMIIIVFSVVLASILTLITNAYGPELVRFLLL